MLRPLERFPRLRLTRAGRSARWVLVLALALSAVNASPVSAQGDVAGDPELRASKTYWQNRYRNLLLDSARLRSEIDRERELYADANRRNYRRGNKRHVHREAFLEAQQELARVEAELATIKDEARRAGALPGWLYEVEFEMEDAEGRPGIASGPESEDDGRNPLYSDDDL